MKNLKMLLLSSLYVVACAPSSPQPLNSDQKGDEQSFAAKNQIVKCQNYSISSFKTENHDDRSFTESNFTSHRSIITSADGLTVKASTIGEGKIIDYNLHSLESPASHIRFYDYKANRTTKIEKMEGGLIKEISQTKMEKTAKEGHKLRDSNGNLVQKVITEQDYEEIYKVDGNKKTLISSKVQGIDQPFMDSVTYTSIEPNRTIEYTTLNKPYEIVENGSVIATVEKDDMYCIYETEK